ncbi:hypothetical protein BJ508DRAFT_371436 [Ascobolus immersus RN42]|uniref:Protein kinase domain-containing protein n=1 Tax=Ascobolus immersus RN42 TaxID=1160509 RepID=A0A3N4IUP2_ASCIM|nr:hypothetical protein BJ508DRAFT_371436 [Ascobolus immersus RN42]
MADNDEVTTPGTPVENENGDEALITSNADDTEQDEAEFVDDWDPMEVYSHLSEEEIESYLSRGYTYHPNPRYKFVDRDTRHPEEAEDYLSKLYLPVCINDILEGNKGSYRIHEKLYNPDSDVMDWAVEDLESTDMLRMTIEGACTTGTAARADEKIAILQFLEDEMVRMAELENRVTADDPVIDHIDVPYDFFKVEGPRGTHLCIVSDLSTVSLDHIWHSDSYRVINRAYDRGEKGRRRRQKLVADVARAVGFLHSAGIIHGRLDALSAIRFESDNRIEAKVQLRAMSVLEDGMLREHGVISPVKRFDGLPLTESDVPPYIVWPLDRQFEDFLLYSINQPLALLSNFSYSRYLTEKSCLEATQDRKAMADEIKTLAYAFYIILADGYPWCDKSERSRLYERLEDDVSRDDDDDLKKSKEDVEVISHLLNAMWEEDWKKRADISQVLRLIPEEWFGMKLCTSPRTVYGLARCEVRKIMSSKPLRQEVYWN